MDDKGFISIEYLFSLFIVLIITCGVLFYASASISSSLNIGDSVAHRIVLDNVANEISQVNSNGVGYSNGARLGLPGGPGGGVAGRVAAPEVGVDDDVVGVRRGGAYPVDGRLGHEVGEQPEVGLHGGARLDGVDDLPGGGGARRSGAPDRFRRPEQR